MLPEVLAWAAVTKPLIGTGAGHAGDPADWGQEVRSIRRTVRAPKAIQGRIHLSAKTDSIEGRPQALACCLLLCSGTFPITPKGVSKQFRNVIGHGGLGGCHT